MSLEQDITTWALTRPAWQQEILADIAEGKTFSSRDYRQLATHLANEKRSRRTSARTLTLTAASDFVAPVVLTSVEIVGNVNRLLPQQKLTFSPDELTVVYGDNGSGKSGFARVLKSIVRARSQEQVLTDIFTDDGSSTPAAVVTYAQNGVSAAASWPRDRPEELARVHFYDRACGEGYITTESEVTYRPSILALFDRLIEVCDGIRRCLDEDLAANVLSRRSLPTVADPSLAAFITGLSAQTRDNEVDSGCNCPLDADQEHAALLQEEAHLLESNPQNERLRIVAIAERLETIGRHLRSLDTALGSRAESLLRSQLEDARRARGIADAASRPSFESEPLSGTGSPVWQSLWDAAREYSLRSAYKGERFPVTRSGALCVFCQQEMADSARARLDRFAAALADTTAQEADMAERRLSSARAAIARVECLPAQISAALAVLDRDEPRLSREVALAVEEFQARKAALTDLESEGTVAIGAPNLPSTDERAASLRQNAVGVDAQQFERRLTEVRQRRVELESKQTTSAAKPDVQFEVARLRARALVEGAKRQVETAAITRKAAELARAHATAVVTDRFTRESDRLRLERITLKDSGGRKGQLRQRPAFLAPKQQAEMNRVLSEGEQTALGLAGFFTEAELDATRSGLVFDDPVSSLSHARRSQVAARLAQFGRDRQVVVFTHDLEFAGELAVAAEQQGITVVERHISRSPTEDPGMCLDGHPWKAKNARGRLAQLRADLERLRRDKATLPPDDYELRVADWAGRLSETWERILKEEISDQLVDPSTVEVRPKMMKVVALVSQQDAKEFEDSYSRISRWVRRHDKARALNYVVPDAKEMANELDLVDAWFNRIRKYKN